MKSMAYDISGAAGLASLAYGVWQVYPPAMWITVGLAILAVSIMGARRWA